MVSAFAKWESLAPKKKRDRELIKPEVRDGIGNMVIEHGKGIARWPLVFWGGPGVGKTCAGLCLCDYARTYPALFPGSVPAYIIATEWIAALTAARSGRYEPPGCRAPIGEHELWDWWDRAGIIFLDELGTKSARDTTTELIQASLDAREGRPLIVASNLGLQELSEVLDDRITSRLAFGTVPEISGEDQRISRARKEGKQ